MVWPTSRNVTIYLEKKNSVVNFCLRSGWIEENQTALVVGAIKRGEQLSVDVAVGTLNT